MRNRDTFSGYHPTINFLYFALVLLFSMCLMHPVYLAISLTGALTYDIYLERPESGAVWPSWDFCPWRRLPRLSIRPLTMRARRF